MPDFVRVRDKDTGHTRSVPEAELPHGNYEVLKEDAVDPITSDLLPPVLAAPKSLSNVSGQKAESKKENAND